MGPQLNHTIVWCRDQNKSTNFLAEILGLPPPTRFLHFLVLKLSNGVSMDYYETTEHTGLAHYAFLVTEHEFDDVFGRIKTRGLNYWADPARTKAGEINTHDGGRGVYFLDPDGHVMEVITRPYGGGA